MTCEVRNKEIKCAKLLYVVSTMSSIYYWCDR